MFCPKCGAILVPKKEGDKKILHCTCGYSNRKPEHVQLSERLGDAKKIEVVRENEEETLPLTDVECPKCHHTKAHFWEVQTRGADEPATKFLKCQKCKHTWRDYS
ncbi:MAG: transcription factor S [Nanoarchaeota archaeon]